MWAQMTSSAFAVTDTDFSTTVTNYIAYADDLIENYCRVPSGYFDAGGVTITNEYHDGREVGQVSLWAYTIGTRSDPMLRLKYTPVISVTTLSEETSAGAWTSRTEGRDDDYLVMENGVRFMANIPSYKYKNVRVTYVAGYAATPGSVAVCSARLAAALLHKVEDATRRQGVSLSALNAEKAIDPSLGANVFTPPLKELVKPYRRHTPARVL
jgi:hypothetical protein